MSYTEMKYAINSSIGTDHFLPLDEKINKLKFGVKLVQRGAYTGSGGYVDIKSVDMDKTYVISHSKGSIDNSKHYSARLHSKTQIYLDGPCEWQVVENW